MTEGTNMTDEDGPFLIEGYVERDGELVLERQCRQYIEDVLEGWTIIANGPDARPTDNDSEWDGTAHVVPIGILRRRKRDEVNAVRQRYQDGGCVTPHGIADTTEKAKINVSGCVQMADRALAKAAKQGVPCEWSLVFTMHDSNPEPNVTLDAEAMGDVGEAVGFHIGKCHAVGVIIKDMIAGANHAAIDLIDVEAIFASAFA